MLSKKSKIAQPKNLTKICFQQPLMLQATVGHVRSPVVAFLWVDVVPHLGVRRTRRRRGKIPSTTQEILFRQHRSISAADLVALGGGTCLGSGPCPTSRSAAPCSINSDAENVFSTGAWRWQTSSLVLTLGLAAVGRSSRLRRRCR
jgi:hypothetical protein